MKLTFFSRVFDFIDHGGSKYHIVLKSRRPLLTCGVVDLRSSDALRRETENNYAQ